MDIGFYHPDRGYWQTIGEPVGPFTVIDTPETYKVDAEGNVVFDEGGFPVVDEPAVTHQTNDYMETCPPGTIQVPLKPGADYERQGGAWVHVPPVPTAADYQASIVAMLDAKARERRYDNAVSISTYVASSNPDWAAEAQAYVAWRDAVWAYAYAELDNVLAGGREQPSVEAFLAELPALTWPA